MPSEVDRHTDEATSVMITFEGIVVLPDRGFRVKQEALGRSFAGKVGRGPFTITLPLASSTEAATPLRTPVPDNPHFEFGPNHTGDHWGLNLSFGTQDLEGEVRGAVVRAQINDASRRMDPLHEFGEQFSHWYTTATQWIELWTGQLVAQDRNRGLHTFANGWDVSADPPTPAQWTYATWTTFEPASGVDPDQLTAAFSRADADDPPPLEWLALINAKRYQDNRLAVIEAATAAEIAMAKAVGQRLGPISAEGLAKITRDANGAAGLVRLLDALDGSDPQTTRRGRVLKLLAQPRNSAVHSGAPQSDDAARAAIRTAHELLDEFSPLPS